MKIKLFLIFIVISLSSCKDKSEIQFHELKTNYQKQIDESAEAFFKAVTDQEKKEVAAKMPDTEKYVAEVLNLVEQHPKSDYAAEAWAEVFKGTWYKKDDPILNKALNALIDDHADSEVYENMEFLLFSKCQNPKAVGLANLIIKENPSPKAKGIMKLALASKYVFNPNSEDYNLIKGKELFEEVKSNFGQYKIEQGQEKKLMTLSEVANGALLSLSSLAVGEKMPEIISKDLDGNEVKLSDYAGNVIVLDVWATWCGPCIEMIPHEREMVKRLADKPFKLISISLDEEVSIIKSFQEQTPMPWINWHNGKSGGIIDAWNITQYPTIIILDKNGVIQHRINGAVKDAQLDLLVDNLLKEV